MEETVQRVLLETTGGMDAKSTESDLRAHQRLNVFDTHVSSSRCAPFLMKVTREKAL